MAKVAYPAMNSSATRTASSTGAIAGGGTLGILIPPSTIMVIYGVMTETNIGKLFAAGILPGILATFCCASRCSGSCGRDPASGPRGRALDLAASGSPRSRACGRWRCCSSS